MSNTPDKTKAQDAPAKDKKAEPAKAGAASALATVAKPKVPAKPKPAPLQSVPPPQPPPAQPANRPPVRRARLQWRHWLALVSFLLLVAVPVGTTIWYLWDRAADQYASYVGFSVRRDEGGMSASGILGGLAQITGSSSSPDGEILYELLQSQQLVADMDRALDLRAIWSAPGRSLDNGDPVFAFGPDGSIEDLLDYWKRMVRVAYDSNSGLIEVRALAFRPEDSATITREILDHASIMINKLNDTAREDAVRYASTQLDEAVERLKNAREALTRFRSRHQIVDPTIDLQTQSGLIGTLQTQLAQALIDADLLRESAGNSDPRLLQADRRIEVIEARIAAERSRLGSGGDEDESDAFAGIVGEYERLQVDHEFAQQSYLAAMAAHDAAQGEARRQSRYLAAHVLPTMAEDARFPQRFVLTGLVALFAFLAWAILVLIAWSLRDRR